MKVGIPIMDFAKQIHERIVVIAQTFAIDIAEAYILLEQFAKEHHITIQESVSRIEKRGDPDWERLIIYSKIDDMIVLFGTSNMLEVMDALTRSMLSPPKESQDG